MKMSVQHLALIGSGNLQLFAILRDGAPRQYETFVLQDADDLRIAQRLPRVFGFDNLADALLDRHRRDAFAVRAADPAVEEVLHFEHALRRVHVLVRHHTAHGRIGIRFRSRRREARRLQIFYAVIEESRWK